MQQTKRLAAALLLAGSLLAQTNTLPTELEGVGVTEKLGQKIDLNLQFVAENGYPVTLGQYFQKGRPVVLNLVYYSCPMLCNLILNGQTATMREIPWTPGSEYEVVTISIDPQETFDLAQKKKTAYLASYERPAPGWHFLTDYQGNVKKLAAQVGFGYKYDERQQNYAHSAAIMILSPDGTVNRYLYGVKYRARDLRLALTEAGEGKIGSAFDKLLLYCFHYDPSSKSYVPFAMNFMRAGGAILATLLISILFTLFRRERLVAARAQGLVNAK